MKHVKLSDEGLDSMEHIDDFFDPSEVESPDEDWDDTEPDLSDIENEGNDYVD